MKMDKVKLNQEEANRIRMLMNDFKKDKLDVVAWLTNTYRLTNDDTTVFKLVNAMLNGYEVELTPEEKIRNYYDHLDEKFKKTAIDHSEWNALRNTMDAVEFVLNTLGVEIEGVNYTSCSLCN